MAKRKIDEQISYNWLFFLLAGGFAAVTAWAVYDETVTRREYKRYQEAFFRVERDLAKEKVAAEKKQLEENARYQELAAEQQKLDAELRTPERKAEIARLRGEVEQQTFVAFDATQAFTFSKSELEEAYYYYRKARHEKSADLAEAERRYRDLDTRTQRDEERMNAEETKKKAAQAKLDEAMHADRLGAVKKEMEAIRRPLDEAERALGKAEAKMAGMTGPATEVVQQDLAEIDKVDRCESCHLGATRGGFETVAQPEFRSHPMRRTLLSLHPPEKFGCTTCHDGQGRATTKFYAHAPSPEEDPHAFHEHYWEFPLLKGPPGGDGTEYMESKCLGCHSQEWDLRSTLPCEADTECPTMPSGRQMICDVPRSRASAGAPFQSVADAERAADAEALRAAGKAPPDLPPQKFCLAWDPGKKQLDPADPDQRKKVVKSAQVALVQLAPNLTRGLQIIDEAGCYGCHPIAGFQEKPKPAPNLTRVAWKADPAWMVEWIKDPTAFRPDTRMPRFWPELLAPNEYPFAVDVDAAKRQQHEEATAMAAFLVTQSRTTKKYAYQLEPIPAGVTGDPERGRMLVGALGCAACHPLPEDTGAKIEHRNRGSHFDHGPDLANVGAKTSLEWLYAWLRDPKRYAPDARMPDMRLSAQEAADMAVYLSKQTGGRSYSSATLPDLTNPELVQKGRELVKYYGCFGCHMIEGFEETPGVGAELTEFGVKTIDRLDFGDYITDHNQQTWDAWTFAKLKKPRVYAYDGKAVMRMPQFALSDDELRAVMVVLKGMRGTDALETQVLAHKLTPTEQARERGREIVRTYNCFGCHTMDGYEGDVLEQLYKGEASPFGPPNLVEEGMKTQPDWLFRFLKEPFVMRPLPARPSGAIGVPGREASGIRMPTFGLSDDEATSLVGMFNALDGAAYPFSYYAGVRPHDADGDGDFRDDAAYRIGRAAFRFSNCTQCHLVEDGSGPMTDEITAPNLVLTKQRLRPEWVAGWMADPQLHLPGTRMPAFWDNTDLLEQALGNDYVKGLLAGLDESAFAAFVGNRERQIEAVRDFVYILTMDDVPPPPPVEP